MERRTTNLGVNLGVNLAVNLAVSLAVNLAVIRADSSIQSHSVTLQFGLE